VNSPTPRPVEGASSLATVNLGEETMTWTKPEFEVVEVTMEVTAYVARR
jgi:coenzyme PQQ precursor peptide PqqA